MLASTLAASAERARICGWFMKELGDPFRTGDVYSTAFLLQLNSVSEGVERGGLVTFVPHVERKHDIRVENITG